MSYGTKITLPLNDPTLIPAVRTHQDYLSKGYVWGENAGVHYCFMDPKKVRFDIWQKRFHPSHLLFLTANLAGAGLALWWGNIPLAVALFLGIPTLQFVLLDHYSATGQEQAAAVVTNGPQMQYPFGLTTAGMFATGVGLFAVGAIVARAILANIGLLSAGVSLGVITLPVGAVKTILAAGMGVNVAAFALYILGLFAKPYGHVVTPTIRDIPTPTMMGWWHIGRSSTPLNTYRMAINHPTGLTWGCGGVIPIIVNKVLSSFASALANPPGPFIPNQVVIWGLLPLATDPTTIPDTFGRSFVGIKKYWHDKRWSDLTDAEKALWRRLGWNEESWAGGHSTTERKRWNELTPDERDAATDLGYDHTSWDELDIDGMLVVAGSHQYTPAIPLALRQQGVTQAIATDGHLSPLLGTHGDLIIETYFALDPIQKYGFMAIPE